MIITLHVQRLQLLYLPCASSGQFNIFLETDFMFPLKPLWYLPLCACIWLASPKSTSGWACMENKTLFFLTTVEEGDPLLVYRKDKGHKKLLEFLGCSMWRVDWELHWFWFGSAIGCLPNFIIVIPSSRALIRSVHRSLGFNINWHKYLWLDGFWDWCWNSFRWHVFLSCYAW